jgi:hypothetical protein
MEISNTRREGVGDFPVLHFFRCLILFLTVISSCVLLDSYVLLADDHVNNASYFPFMSIKNVVRIFVYSVKVI